MQQKDAIGRLHEWVGSHVVLVAREPNHPDTLLLESFGEAESKELCACAMAILLRRTRLADGRLSWTEVQS